MRRIARKRGVATYNFLERRHGSSNPRYSARKKRWLMTKFSYWKNLFRASSETHFLWTKLGGQHRSPLSTSDTLLQGYLSEKASYTLFLLLSLLFSAALRRNRCEYLYRKTKKMDPNLFFIRAFCFRSTMLIVKHSSASRIVDWKWELLNVQKAPKKIETRALRWKSYTPTNTTVVPSVYLKYCWLNHGHGRYIS